MSGPHFIRVRGRNNIQSDTCDKQRSFRGRVRDRLMQRTFFQQDTANLVPVGTAFFRAAYEVVGPLYAHGAAKFRQRFGQKPADCRGGRCLRKWRQEGKA